MKAITANLKRDAAETFGRVSWHNDDIQDAAVEKLGRKLTKKELAKVRDSYYIRHIADTMVEQGWENIHLAIEEMED